MMTAAALATTSFTTKVPTAKHYVQDISQMSAYVWSLCNTKAPNISHVPTWYANFLKDLQTAKKDAQAWTDDWENGNDLGSLLITVPTYFTTYQPTIDAMCVAAGLYEEDPSESNYNNLLAAIGNASYDLSNTYQKVEYVFQRLRDFNKTLVSDEAKLAADAATAQKSVKTNKQEVNEVLSQISQLKLDIFLSSVGLAADTLEEAIGVVDIGIGLVAMVAAPEVEPLDVLEVIGGCAELSVGVAATIADSVEIANDAQSIESLYNQLDTDEQQLVIVQQIATQFGNIADSGRTAEIAMNQILTLWNQIYNITETIKQDAGDLGKIIRIQPLWDELGEYAAPLGALVSSVNFSYSSQVAGIKT